MQQKYRIVLLIFTLSSVCQALPMKPESFFALEAIKSTNSEITPNNTANFTSNMELEETPALRNNIFKPKDPADDNHETLKTFNISKSNGYSLEDASDFNAKDFEDATEKAHQTSGLCKDFENDFKLLENRMPDLTEEEYKEINKEGATPWNFLKKIKTNRDQQTNETTPDPMQYLTPVYITIPIVINSQTSLPLSLRLGEQNIALKFPALHAAKGETSTTHSSGSIVNNNLAVRQTNRHRSNFHKKIYALNYISENDQMLDKN